MSENRLGELSENQMKAMMEGVFDEAFDQMSAEEFFGTLKAMDEADVPERVVINGHLENGEFVPHAVSGATLVGRSIRIDKKALVEIHIESH